MKKIVIFVSILFWGIDSYSQNFNPFGIKKPNTDTLVVISELDSTAIANLRIDSILQASIPQVDSVLIDSVLFYDFKESLSYIKESDSLSLAMEKYVEANKERTITGYSLRIFLNNSQDSRHRSEEKLISFVDRYPGLPTSRVYENPYWKVTVGRFRTKAEALRFKEKIEEYYPGTFLVKENFSTIE